MKLTFRCKECNQKLNVGHAQIGSVVTCPACGAVQSVPAPLARKYPVLRVTAVVLQVVAVLVALILLALVLIRQNWAGQPVIENVILLSLGIPISLLAGLLIYALGEGILLFIDIEENSRAMRQLLELKRSEQKASASVPQA